MTIERAYRLRDFAVARFVRLYPPFVVGMLITATILISSGFSPGHGFGPDDLTAGQVAANLSIATYLLGIRLVDPVYWTLSYELLFYVLISAAVFGLRIKKVELFGLVWLVAAYTAKFVLHISPPRGTSLAFSVPIVTGSEFAYLFVAGMMLRRLHFIAGCLLGACWVCLPWRF
jgi:peptidoglycan/LPS O-acetylase OafA/YrhL